MASYITVIGSYSTYMGSHSTPDGSYCTLDGELQHTGRVKIQPEVLQEDVETFLGKTISYFQGYFPLKLRKN
jgi:hypothetical protein